MAVTAALWSVENWGVAWREGFIPWLREHAPQAWRDAGASVVVLPTKTDTYHAKKLALEEGISPLALHFVTPPELRQLLQRELGVVRTHPLREHLRLLLSIAAEETEGEASAAIAAAPDALLHAVNVLGDGGWDFQKTGPAAARPVVERFQQLLDRCKFHLLHDTDRALLAAARTVFSRVLVLGFDAAHWPAWPVLATAVRSAEKATVLLRFPRLEAQELDSAWIGTWEESFGSAEPLAGDSPSATRTHFLVGYDTAEQARAVVQQALAFLADPACTRLGILVPGEGALARRIAAFLAELGVPHHDGLGHIAPGPCEAPDWPAWIALQETPRLPALLRFLRASPQATTLFPAEAENQLSRAFSTLLLDDLESLATWLADQPVAKALRAFPRLPEQGTLGEFLAAAEHAFAWLGWTDRAADLQRLSTGWSGLIPTRFARRSFLRWLGEVLASPLRDRAPEGRHPYSRAYLLPAAQAEAQSWSHLIIAGLNEGQWPPPFDDSGWLGEEELSALNQRVRQLNQRATRQGSQGEGHTVVAPGHTLCLGPRESRAIADRRFLNTVESAGTAIALAANLIDEAVPDRPCNASEFFIAHYHRTRGSIVSHDTLAALREKTARWLAEPAPAFDPMPVAATFRAFTARRTAGSFGPYEFARATPPNQPLRLAATDWERALRNPAAAWLRHVLGVCAPEEAAGETPWNQSLGSWAHRWLAAIGGSERGVFISLPGPDEIIARTRRAADDFRARVTAMLATQHRSLPDWWIATWQQARTIALRLAGQVASVSGPTHLATEWPLAETAIALDASSQFRVRGFIDLLLTEGPGSTGAWIVDYKTGEKDSLTPKRAKSEEERIAKVAESLRRADGLQLALYALAIERPLGITRLAGNLPLDEPQLTPADVGLEAQHDFWLGLCHMQNTAIFGSVGKLRDDYSFSGDLPLATLRIDPDLLAEKWALTHPRLAASEGVETT